MQEENDKLLFWKTRAFKIWAIIGICVLIWITLYVCGIIWSAVATIITAALVVFLLHGIVNYLQRKGIPRWVGTTIAFLLLFGVILGSIVALVPAIITQLTAFAGNLPAYTEKLQSFAQDIYFKANSVAQFSSWLAQAGNTIQANVDSIIKSLAGGLLSGMINAGNAVAVFFMSLLVAFWVLLDLPKIFSEIRSLVKESHQGDIDIISNAFGTAVYGWVESTLLCAIITGLASGICFWICGIPYPVVLGFICGLLYVVPYIGPAIACAIVAVIALFVSPFICIVSIIINVIINNVVASILSPRLMKSSINVHPAIILIVIMIGGGLGGVIGMLAAIPIAAAIQGIFITYFEARTGRTLATEDGALFQKKTERQPFSVFSHDTSASDQTQERTQPPGSDPESEPTVEKDAEATSEDQRS